MTMQYKIFENGTGVILTRQPDLEQNDLFVEFVDAPLGATAIFETKNGDSFYRVLEDGVCSFPVSRLSGEVKVTLAILDGKTPPHRWICEEFKVSNLKNGGTLIAPNDMNLPQRFVELKLENEVIRKANERLEKRLSDLENQFEKLLEGYDLT